MSNVLLKAGVGADLFNAVQAWVGHWPGGLAVATILSCAFFAAIYGSSVATAATIGFAASMVIGALILRSLNWAGFHSAVKDSMVTTVAILLIVAGAKIFGKAIALYRIPQDISMFISQNVDTALVFILVVSVVLLLMGLVFEALSMVLIMTPVLLPGAMSLGFDPIWFGIYMVILVECALITPPVGLNLYVIQSVAKAPLGDVSRGVLPFLALMLLTVVVLYLVPDLALYIPFKM